MTHDTENDDIGTDDETCPICGQEYDHRREERQGARTPDPRADVVECKTEWVGMKRTVYVHLTDEPRPVSKTVATNDTSDGDTGLEALFS